MKLLVVFLLVVAYIEASSTPNNYCNANTCTGCTANSDCVWCDQRCVKKDDDRIACMNRITSMNSCLSTSATCCEYKGKSYDFGDTFLDDCNDCTCNRDGSVTCTLKLCLGACESYECPSGSHCVVENGAPSCKQIDDQDLCEHLDCGSGRTCFINQVGEADCCLTCEYGGKTYKEGDRFDATDKCNTCTCISGQVCCTEKACDNKSDDKSKDNSGHKSNDKSNDKSDDKSGQKSDDKSKDNSGHKSNDKSNDKSDDKSGQKSDDKSKDNSGKSDDDRKLDNRSNDKSGDKSGNQPDDDNCESDDCEYDDCDSDDDRKTDNRSNDKSGDKSGNQPGSKPGPKPGHQSENKACKTNKDCDSDCFCSKLSCDDTEGACARRPESCIQVYIPVCGCDGKTYGHSCTAASAGMNVNRPGECESTLPVNPCAAVLCETGTYCVVKNGKPECARIDDTDLCDLLDCGDGKECFINQNGEADCCDLSQSTTPTNPCMTVRCGYGTQCITKPDGTAACVNVTCDYYGTTYNAGESFDCTDGCNTCQCEDGEVKCTENTCEPKPCQYDGKNYDNGKSFDCTDGCNTCQCEDGEVKCTENTCEPKPCQYDGKNYDNGKSFDCTDGCNTCQCEDGEVKCTENTCEPKPCQYDGKNYDNGKSFDCTDGCNTCQCEDGEVKCTENTCEPKPCQYGGKNYNPGESFPCTDGCNTCNCNAGEVACTEIECPEPEMNTNLPTTCATNKDCKSEFYCKRVLCTDDKGTCTPRPELCTSEYKPVCGCDNKTYSNECAAGSEGVSVHCDGAC